MVQGKKVFDIREACCLESAGLGKRLRELPSDEVLEVIMDKTMKETAEEIRVFSIINGDISRTPAFLSSFPLKYHPF
jgi:TusA-related sulfurtransferase